MMASEEKPSAKTKDRWFDGWLIAKGAALKELCEDTGKQLAAYETRTGLRKGGGRRKSLPAFMRRVEGITCNLALLVLKPGTTGKIVTPLRKGDGKRSRYDNKLFDAQGIKPILSRCEGLGLLTVNVGAWKGEATTIQPTPGFKAEVLSRGISRKYFGRDRHQELIVLTRTTKGGKPGEEDTGEEADDVFVSTVMGGLLDYRDTDRTNAMRAHIRQLADHLEAADIRYLGNDPDIDVDDRLLRRHFSLPKRSNAPTFDLGGRLFCRGLSYIPKHQRHHLRIDGEPVVLADYSAMFPHLMYGVAGETPPSCDLYDLPGFGPDDRPGIKMAFNALLFGAGRQPRSMWPEDVREKLPKGAGVMKVRKAIFARHPVLLRAGRWETKHHVHLGYHLMFLESEIMAAVLGELMALSTTAIGLHDGLLAPASKAGIVKEIMEAKALAIGNVAIPIVVKDVKPGP